LAAKVASEKDWSLWTVRRVPSAEVRLSELGVLLSVRITALRSWPRPSGLLSKFVKVTVMLPEATVTTALASTGPSEVDPVTVQRLA
jgi:hypothetical protein